MMRCAMKKILFVILLMSAMAANAGLIPGHETTQAIEINADSLEVLQAEKRAIFSGNVLAEQGSMKLRADKMLVYYGGNKKKSESSNNSISKIEVIGNVFLSSPKETAKGYNGVYDTNNGVVVLSGDVVLTRGQNIIKGSELTFDINSGRSKITKSEAATESGECVRGLFVPEGKQE